MESRLWVQNRATASVGGLVSRTPVPDRLVHQPEEVKRNAERFDQLCRLAEEVALPVVQKALVRETAATGVQALTDEAKLALEGLVAESALVELDDPSVLEEVRRSLEQAIPPPSEEECLAMTRDVAQVLMSTWLEILRKDLSTTPHLVLSDQLLPLGLSSTFKSLLSNLGMPPAEPFSEDGLGALALDESDASHIMKTLRHKLFSESRLVELPFELLVAGAPERPVFAMTQATYRSLLDKVASRPPRQVKPVPATPAYTMQYFVTPAAQVAAANLSAHLSENHYALLSQHAGIGTYLYRVAGRS